MKKRIDTGNIYMNYNFLINETFQINAAIGLSCLF